MDRAKGVFGDKDNLLGMLAAAGGSGLLGGYLSSQTPERHGETRSQRRLRILQNAALTAGAGGAVAGTGLLAHSFLTDPEKEKTPPGLIEAILGSPSRALSMGATAVGGGLGNRFGARADKATAFSVLRRGNKKGMNEDNLKAVFNSATPSAQLQSEAYRKLRDTVSPNANGVQRTPVETALATKAVEAQLSRAGMPLARPGRNQVLNKSLSAGSRQFRGWRGLGGLGGALAGLALSEGGQWGVGAFNRASNQ